LFPSSPPLLARCETQEEVDAFWSGLSEGGEEGPCGWLKDKFGASWQIVPKVLNELIADPDPEKSQRVMSAMLEVGKIDIAGLRAAYDGTATHELRFGVEFEGVEPHSHSDHVDSFYVLEGEAEFVMGNDVLRAGPGTFVAAPIGVVHGFRNAGDGELRMLNVHAPNVGFAQRLRRA
jgi:mannose-6-phosphate isomerase-like protein (cupin superfamily)